MPGCSAPGCLWSVVAFLLCAAAPSFGWLLFFRFLQGISAGLIISCAPAMVTSLYPEARRSQALGIFTLMFAHRLGAGAADRRGAGGALGLARGVLVPRADRADQPVAAARPAAGPPARREQRSISRRRPARGGAGRRCCWRSTRCRACRTATTWRWPCFPPPPPSLAFFVWWEGRAAAADRPHRAVPRCRFRDRQPRQLPDVPGDLLGDAVRARIFWCATPGWHSAACRAGAGDRVYRDGRDLAVRRRGDRRLRPSGSRRSGLWRSAPGCFSSALGSPECACP